MTLAERIVHIEDDLVHLGRDMEAHKKSVALHVKIFYGAVGFLILHSAGVPTEDVAKFLHALYATIVVWSIG